MDAFGFADVSKQGDCAVITSGTTTGGPDLDDSLNKSTMMGNKRRGSAKSIASNKGTKSSVELGEEQENAPLRVGTTALISIYLYYWLLGVVISVQVPMEPQQTALHMAAIILVTVAL